MFSCYPSQHSCKVGTVSFCKNQCCGSGSGSGHADPDSADPDQYQFQANEKVDKVNNSRKYQYAVQNTEKL